MRITPSQAVPEVSEPLSRPVLQPSVATQRDVPPPVSAPALQQDKVNLDTARIRERKLNIEFDENRNMIYRFVDSATGDLIQQVPSDEVLKVVRSIQEMLRKAGSAQP